MGCSKDNVLGGADETEPQGLHKQRIVAKEHDWEEPVKPFTHCGHLTLLPVHLLLPHLGRSNNVLGQWVAHSQVLGSGHFSMEPLPYVF